MKLLGRHVRRAADDRGTVRGDIEESRRAEVADLQNPVFGDQHVARSKVAMKHAGAVRVIDGIADLAAEVERPRHLERPSRMITCSSVSPCTSSITMKNTSSCFSAVSTVTMLGWLIEARSRGSFHQLAEIEVLLVGDLDCDFLVDPGVFREVNAAEATTAER